MEGFIEDMQKLPWNYKDGLYGPSHNICLEMAETT